MVDVQGNKVCLSFDFPREMSINRRELADLKAKQDNDGSAQEPTETNPGPGD